MKVRCSAQYRLKSWSSVVIVPYTVENYTPISLPVSVSSVYPVDGLLGAVYIRSHPHFIGHLCSNSLPV